VDFPKEPLRKRGGFFIALRIVAAKSGSDRMEAKAGTAKSLATFMAQRPEENNYEI